MLNKSGLFRKEFINVLLAHVNEDKVDVAYNHTVYME